MTRTDDKIFGKDHPPPTDGFLAKLADFTYRRKWWVLLGWVLAVIVLGVTSGAVKGEFKADYSTPGSDSAAMATLVQDRFPGSTGDTLDIVWKAEGGAKEAAVQDRMNALFAKLDKQDGVGTYSASARDLQVSKDGKIAQASIPLSRLAGTYQTKDVLDIQELVEDANGGGVQIEVGGQFGAGGGDTPKAPGFLAAMLILLIAFGTVVATGLPIITAVFGLAVGSILTMLLAAVTAVPEWTPAVADLLGIGVGIDYALLVLTRFRDALDRGHNDVRAALIEAVTTAGRSVAVAGTTVVVAVLGLFLIGVEYMRGVAMATSLTILIVMLTAITLMPALLAMFGTKINKLKLPGVKTAAQRRKQENDPDHLPPAARWSRQVQRRPWVMTVVATAFLLLIASPVFGMKLGFPDNSNLGSDVTGHRAYDLVEQGFGTGTNGPLVVAADLEKSPASGGKSADVEKLTTAIKNTPGIVSVAPPAYSQGGNAALLIAIPKDSPQAKSTEDVVTKLRDDVIPGALAGTEATALVGGATAAAIDQSDYLRGKIGIFVSGILLLSLLVLLLAFRSPVIAVKATVMNLLSIGAAYGVITLASNGSWFGELVGISEAAPVAPFLPVMMFAILFGLSMDYEVFLMSRVREEYLNGRETHEAVTVGLARTARVITAAAAIMVAVFMSFALAPDVFLRQMGVGMATAVLVDATIVRMVLVPAVLQLLGNANWWIPGWLDRMLPHWDVERRELATEPS